MKTKFGKWIAGAVAFCMVLATVLAVPFGFLLPASAESAFATFSSGAVLIDSSYNGKNVIIKNGEANVLSMHISPYDKGNIFNHDPDRPKKLLLHKREINKLYALVKQDGYALVPLSVYFKDARVKIEVGVCKGKKNYDKREDAARRDAKREMDRAMKARR